MSLQKDNLKSSDCVSCEGRKESIFCNLSPTALQIINESKVTKNYSKGSFIFLNGDKPAGLYCINSGVVKLETVGSTGNSHILRVLSAGSVLGYRSLFSNDSYKANAFVHENSEVCFIPKASLMQVIEKEPEVGFKLLSLVSRELQIAEKRFCAVSDKNVQQRIAEAVLFLRENFSEQKWTRKDIAEWASTTPETVIRTLSDFEAQGFIAQEGRFIRILKRESLVKLADLIH